MKEKHNIEKGFERISTGDIHFWKWPDNGARAHFLHANGFCSGVYGPFIDFFCGEMSVTASDIRGHGNSDPLGIDKITGWKIFSEDLKEFLEKKMTLPVTGMGHSFGAVITLMAAAQYPYLFDKIILIDPVILPLRMLAVIKVLKSLHLEGIFPLAKQARRRKRSFPTRDDAVSRFLSGRGMFRKWEKDFIFSYVEHALYESEDGSLRLKCGPETEAQVFESVPDDIWKYMESIKCPVLVVRGSESDTFLLGAAKKLERKLKDIEIVSLENCGHFVPMEKPMETAEVIIDFMRRKAGNQRGASKEMTD